MTAGPQKQPARRCFTGLRSLALVPGAVIAKDVHEYRRPRGNPKAVVGTPVGSLVVNAASRNTVTLENAWLRAVLASALDPVLTIDGRGVISSASESVERVFGWKAEELIGQNVAVLMPEPHHSRHDSYLQQHLETGRTALLGVPRQLVAVRRNGDEFPCEIAVARVDLAGEPPMFVGIVRDISPHKRVEEKLQQLNDSLAEKNKQLETFVFNAEKLASVGKLAASVAHEIRNPLTALKVRLFSIRRAVAEEATSKTIGRSEKLAKLDGKFELLFEEIDRLESVVHNFLEYTRPPTPNPRACPIRRLAGKTVELVAHRLRQQQVEFRDEIPPEVPAALVDPEQLKQVLLNLATNALDVMPTGGVLTISAEHRGREVIVRVSDTGPGIEPESASRVFEPFFSTKAEGIGLGLSICRQIVGNHGGRLEVEPREAGACFALHLPAAEEPESHPL